MYSQCARDFASQAISDSTRRTYRAAIRQFEIFCISRGWSLYPITTQHAVEWFTLIGKQARLASGTLLVYRSALSTEYRESTMGEGLNPLDAKVVTMVLEGIQRVWYPREAAARAVAPQTIDLTPKLLHNIKSFLPTAEPFHTMVWAAASLGVAALLRPSELLGSAQSVKQGMIDTRALRLSQITFYKHAESQQVATFLSRGADIDEQPLPDRFTVALGQTKSDQLGKRGPKVVAAAFAVEALWRWCHLRRSLGASQSPLLFACDGASPLTMPTLLAAIKRGLINLGFKNPKVTGKCFRRGGTSSLVEQGIGNEDVARVGDWRSSTMVNIYSNKEAQEARRIAVSRSMRVAAQRPAAASSGMSTVTTADSSSHLCS